MKFLIFLGLLITTSSKLLAQAAEPDVQKLVLNSSPAYFLLGVQPDNIQKPSTPRDFVGGVQSAIVNQQLQPNFALEFNPLNWFDKTNKIKANAFIANDYFRNTSKGKLDAMKKNIAFSLATSSSDTVVFGKLQPGLGLAYGFRFTLLPGTVNKQTTDNFRTWEVLEVRTEVLQTILQFKAPLMNGEEIVTKQNGDTAFEIRINDAIKNHLVSGIQHNINNSPTFIEADKANLRQEVESYFNNLSVIDISNTAQETTIGAIEQAKHDVTDSKLQILHTINQRKIPFGREGFIVEAAAGGVTVFQNNLWQDSHYGKSAFWLTPTYTFNLLGKQAKDTIESIDFMGVLRYIWNDKKVDSGNYFDAGLKLQFNRNAWNASLEWTARHASQSPDSINSRWTHCWLFNFSYTINEIATLKFSFGSNFDGNTSTYTSPKQMFALGGINLGMFGNGNKKNRQ